MSDECKCICEFCGKSFCTPWACNAHKRGCSKNPSPQTKSKDGGWVEKVSKVTGLSRRQIYKVVNSTDLINFVYRR